MSLHQYFKSKLQTMEPGETVTYTRDALASLVEREQPCIHDPLREESSPEGSSGTAEECHSVAELAERFGRGVSTVRGWCAAGLFGDRAECWKGRGWSVPESRVQEVETRLKDGWRIVDNGWVEPGAGGENDDSGVDPRVKTKRKHGRTGTVCRTVEVVADEEREPADGADSCVVRIEVRVKLT